MLWFVGLWLCVTGEAGTLPIASWVKFIDSRIQVWTTDVKLCLSKHVLQTVPGHRGMFKGIRGKEFGEGGVCFRLFMCRTGFTHQILFYK